VAEPTPVNGQITDAITQANLTEIGNAPALTAMAMLGSLAQTTGLAMQNAVNAQQQLTMAGQQEMLLAALRSANSMETLLAALRAVTSPLAAKG